MVKTRSQSSFSKQKKIEDILYLWHGDNPKDLKKYENDKIELNKNEKLYNIAIEHTTKFETQIEVNCLVVNGEYYFYDFKNNKFYNIDKHECDNIYFK